MDLLSDILHTLRIRGRLFFGDTLTAPWELDIPGDLTLKLHFVAAGACRIDVGDGFKTLPEGSLAVLPSALEHRIVSQGEATQTRLVCGEFHYDTGLNHPLLEQLPPILLRGCDDCARNVWLAQAMNLLALETARDAPGQSALVERLLEIVLIQALRQFIEEGGLGARFLAGMSDRALVKALHAMHEFPETPWTVARLARQAALSRTAFATRFQRVLGEPPMQYLTRWRMLRAAQQLVQTRLPIEDIAIHAGYQSEASFGKVFKRIIGQSPGRYRRLGA